MQKWERIKIINEKIAWKNIPHLCDMVDNLKKPGEWKMHLTMSPKFMPLIDINENAFSVL